MSSVGLSLGFRDAEQRARGRWSWLSSLLSLGTVLFSALLFAASVEGPSGARRAEADLLRGIVFGLIVPIYSFAASARFTDPMEQLMRASAARYGADRRLLALGRLGFTWAAGFGLTLVSGVAAFALSRTAWPAATGDATGPGLVHVLLAALLGTLSYASWLALAQLLGGARGRLLFLGLDWLFGSGAGILAWPWPRAQLRSLLGGERLVSGDASSAALALLLGGCAVTLIYARRVPR